jgi:ketosteroid isomerase-like protein
VPVDRQTVADWLDGYVAAWKSYDPDAIGALFSEDATYAYHPWEEPLRGRTAIVADWLANQDPPGSFEAAYEPVAVDGDVAVATGRSRYFEGDGSLAREYWNCYVLRFDAAGRCREFTEWYMKRQATDVEE